MKISNVFKVLALMERLDDIATLPKEVTSAADPSTATTLAGGRGKSQDGIAAGTSTPYKSVNPAPKDGPDGYPELAKVCKAAREDALKGRHLVDGLAFNELKDLAKTDMSKPDGNGGFTLPWRGVRLVQDGKAFYVEAKES